MSRPLGMALGGAAVVTAVALPSVVAVAYYFGGAAAWSLVYGVLVGVAIFSTIAFAVTMIFGPTTEMKRLVGAGIYVGRFAFAAGAILVPITLELWPVVPMLCGFVGVYIVENVALLLAAARVAGGSSMSETEG